MGGQHERFRSPDRETADRVRMRPGQDRITVTDLLELRSLRHIVRKQGYLFNQAVHTLNTIAQKIRNGSAMN